MVLILLNVGNANVLHNATRSNTFYTNKLTKSQGKDTLVLLFKMEFVNTLFSKEGV